MNKRLWLWLLLPLLLFPGMATAQFSRQRPAPVAPMAHKESHHDLPGGLDLSNPQELMAQRLRGLEELHQLQDQVRELLKDPKFREQMGNFSDEQLQRLREKLLKGEGLSQDRTWARLLDQVRAHNKLDQGQIDYLKRWAERAEKKQPSREPARATPDNEAKSSPSQPPPPPSDSASPPPDQPTPTEPAPSLLDRFQEDTTKWLMENFEGVSGDFLQALTEIGDESNTPLADLLRSVPQSDFSGINLRDHPLLPALQTGTISRYLSGVGDFFHRQSGFAERVGALFPKPSLPSLPNVGGPSVSMHTPSTPESDGWLPAVLCLLLFGMIVLLVWKKGFGSSGQAGFGADGEWKLGSWPVPPGAVSTRQDLIRAFEYLALLCLGPAAATCHHRQLAERLAELPPHPPVPGGMGGASRRQTAEMLAWLYEQARYAPADEALSQEQLSDARHALSSLAGVTTA